MKKVAVVFLALLTVGSFPLRAQQAAKPAGGVAAEEEAVQEGDAAAGPTGPKREVVSFNPKNKRDPMLSPDDVLWLKEQERKRLKAIEDERKRQEAEKARIEAEKRRKYLAELERLKDPTKEVRNKIHIGGLIGKEVFIGDKIYTVGNTIHGATIVDVTPEEVIFTYKGHQFRKKVEL